MKAIRLVAVIRTLTWWLDRTNKADRHNAAWMLWMQRSMYRADLRNTIRRRLQA